jgi:PAS domain S-box-containing protein
MINFFTPPDSRDKETAAKAQIFFRVVIGSAIIATCTLLFELIALPQNNQRWIFIACIFDLVSLCLLFLNGKGKTRLASYLFASILIVLIFGLAWSGGGIKAPVIQEIPIVVLAVGLMLGWKKSVLYAVGAVAASAGLVVAEYLGLLPVSNVVPTSLSVLANSTMQIGLLLLLQYLIVANLDRALQEAREQVTQRSKVEESLQESEKRFRLILDNMPILLNAFDDKGIFIIWNKACEETTGYMADEIIGNPRAMELLYPDSAYRAKVWNSSLDPDNKENVYDLVTKKGERRTIEWFDIYHHLKVPGWATWGMGQDITERKRAEEALRESEERMRAIVEGTPHLFFYTQDTNATTTYVSPTVEQITGYTVDTWLKRKDWFVTDAKINQLAKEKTNAHLQGESTQESIFIEIRHANGNPILLEAYEYPIFHNGRVIGLQGVAHDITGRKRADQERRALYEIVEGVTTTTNLDELLELVHQSLGKVLYAENCFVALHDQNTGLFSFPYFVDKFDSTPAPAPLLKSCTSYVFRSGKPLLIPQHVFNQLLEENEVELVGSPSPSWIGVPLQTPLRTIGVLVLQHYEKENVYTEHDLKFLSSIGSQVALIIERKQAEAALRDSETKLNVILQSTADGILAVDRNGKVLRTNKRFAELWHIPESLMELKDDSALLNYVLSQLADPEEFLSKVRSLYASSDEGRDTLRFKDGGALERYSAPIIMGGDVIGRVWSFRDITDRKRAEEALRENEERYRALFTFSPDALYVHVDGRVTLVNPAICRLLGASDPSQLIGKSVFDIVHPEFHAIVRERMKLVDAGQPAPLLEEKYNRIDGTSVDVEVSAVAVDWKGSRTVQVIARDITERKRAEEALRFERLLLRTLIDNIPDSIYSKDMSCRKTLANTAEVRHLQVNSEEDVVGKNDFEFYPKELAEGFFADDQFVLQSGEALLDREEYVFNEKGEKRWLLTSKLPLRDKKGRTIGLVGIGRDITERKRGEEELRKLSLAVEQSPTSIVITDIHGKIEYVNPKFTQVTGYTMEEVRGKNPNILKSGETSNEEYKNMWETISAGKAWRGEFRNKKKNGEFFWEMASISPVKNQENVIVNFVAVKEDITERKQVEEALRNAQKLESIGTLAGGIAHDFNNLLNAILGQSTLALNKLSNENPAKDHIEKSMKAAERAADLTRHLLAYSGKGKFITEEMDLNRLVKENIQILELSVPKTAQLMFELGAPSPHIQGDVGQIQQVIMNLIINAGEAITPNPGTITVQSGRADLTENDAEYWKYTNAPLQPGKYALLRVSDTGHGIKPDVLLRIFDPFFTTKFTGRGLGLAAVLGIVRGHRGGLRIESREGKGTTFEVVFPLLDAPVSAAEQEEKAATIIDGKGKTLLVIDDEPSILELLKDIFTDANFKVIAASTPMEGIELYRTHPGGIAMVILDYSMPGMDGKAAFEELMKIDTGVKVLLCSGYSEEEMKSAFGDIRPGGFIKKPYKPTELLENVSIVLSGGKSEA